MRRIFAWIVITLIATGLATILLISALGAIFTMLLWNWLLAGTGVLGAAGIPLISFLEAWGVTFLSTILFKGIKSN